VDIPRLGWQERSDWINVKTRAKPAAIGDGRADDTAAIQAALDVRNTQTGDSITVYLPPGTYRITKTLVFRGRRMGCRMIGHGRDTRLVWDGPGGGRMFWSNGIGYSRYIGLSWDGSQKAAVGFAHASEAVFETEITHDHESFRNFTVAGIQVASKPVASAEILYYNCLFENCEAGLMLLGFNDYDNTLDHCEFRHCGCGVLDRKGGNFYARNSHFEGSRATDFFIGSEHGSTIRRCTSVGSKHFIESGTIGPLTIQDCHVAGWTDPEGAVFLNGSPVLMFDCAFSRPPSDGPPVKLVSAQQRLLLSNNRPAESERLVQKPAPTAKVYVLPPGRRTGVVASAEQHFLKDTVAVPGKVFDAVRDFGAQGDGHADDTAAVQRTIDAARAAGHGAMAYLPTGRYLVSKTLLVAGRDYTFGGSGFRCGLVWNGEPGRTMVEVSSPQNITLEGLAIGNHDFGPMKHGDDVRVTSATGVPCRLVLDEVYGFGMYQKKPDLHGIHFIDLPKGSVIDVPHVQGNLHITNCARATMLFRTSYEGTVTIDGAATPRDGFLGFLTRLTTTANPTLRICDNQSVVMSDFYGEQIDKHVVFEGKPGQPEGAATLQGPKIHTWTQEPVLTIDNYAGRIYYGQSQFYTDPKEPRFLSRGTQPLRLILAGHFWYGTRPRFELGPSVKLTLLGNWGGSPSDGSTAEIADQGIDHMAMAAMAAAFDDLRQLGELDLKLAPKGIQGSRRNE
jgi:hypothetical protein